MTGIQTVKASALEPVIARRWDSQLAAYVVENGKVKITSPSQGTMVLKIDGQGCLDGGAMMGKLCKR